MKYIIPHNSLSYHHVALFARAWIEISVNSVKWFLSMVALFARAWIEIEALSVSALSQPVALFARAWIEIISQLP